MMTHDQQLDELRAQSKHLMGLATQASELHLATASILTEHKVRILALEQYIEKLLQGGLK